MGLLRSLFGPSREEVWSELCRQMGAQYVAGGFWKGDKVVATIGQWPVTLDTYTTSSGQSSTTYTRMRAPFVNKDGFHFNIYRRSVFSGLGKMLGMQDVQIGEPVFDEDFIIKANNEVTVRRFLDNPRLRSLFQAQPRISLEVRDDEGWFGTQFPQGVDAMYFSTVGVIKDLALLRGLYELFAEALNQLCHIGSAYENDPGLTL